MALYCINNVSRVEAIFVFLTIALIAFIISLYSKVIIMIVRFLSAIFQKSYIITILLNKTQKQIFTGSYRRSTY